MKPQETFTNGDGGSGDRTPEEDEICLEDPTWPSRALSALNALRKSRQHYDVLLAAEGVELPAHRAVLAAASPRLLADLPPADSTQVHRVAEVQASALSDLLEYMYTGRLSVRADGTKALYEAAWVLRVEAARAKLAERLVKRLSAQDCLAVRALPGLSPEQRMAVDKYISDNLDIVWSTGGVCAWPSVLVEMVRGSSADDGEEAPAHVAAAALAWLRAQIRNPNDLDEVCSRPHLLYVNAEGDLQDCGQLPAARDDAPELQEYRRAAAERIKPTNSPPINGPTPELEWRVVAAGRVGPRATRALLSLGGKLVCARISWRQVSSAAARGGPLVGTTTPDGSELALLEHPRCAHGTAVLGGRVIVCGGYDRVQALKSVESYDFATNSWSPLKNMRGARARFSAAKLGETVYAVGGSDGHAELDTVEAMTVDGGWSCKARLPSGVSHCAAAADEKRGELYCVGGWAAGVPLKSVLKYSPSTDTWSSAPSLLAARSQPAGVVWKDSLWALGGCDAWHCLATTEALSLSGGSAWVSGPALPTARRSIGGAVWRDCLVAAGGSDGATSLRRTEWLTSDSKVWSRGPDLRVARAALGLAVLGEKGSDSLLAVGGFDGKHFLASVECLRSPNDEWTTLREPRSPARALITAQANSVEDQQEHKENGLSE